MIKSFKEFIETIEAKSDFLSTLQDELGISPEEMMKFPQVGLNFSLGKLYNIGTVEIVEFKKDDNDRVVAAKIKVIKDPSVMGQKMYSQLGDKTVRMPRGIEVEEKVYTVPIDKLKQLLTQGLSQQPSNAGGLPGEMPGGLGI